MSDNVTYTTWPLYITGVSYKLTCLTCDHIYFHVNWHLKALQKFILATCGRDKRIWIWSIDDDDDYECASVLSSHTQDVKSVSWHPHKDTLMSTSYDDSIKIYEEQEDDWECINTLGKSLAVDVHDAQNDKIICLVQF